MSAGVIVDAREREAALDPQRSFIVQAPAGSGKTGLLIQRYLALLATVARPEEILAITFTRKAAAEMRQRVLAALGRARDDHPPERDNDRLTWRLAREALVRDAAAGWGLLQNAARLRIQTIDSLSAALARQMPVLSGLGTAPAIVEDARELYAQAAERALDCLGRRGEDAQAVTTLLRHLDGDWNALRALLEAMLARRDQWLPRVAGFDADEAARAELEGALRAERARILGRLRALMPPQEQAEIAALARYAAKNLVETGSASRIARLVDLGGYPPGDETGAELWHGLADLLLKGNGTDKEAGWRAQVNKNQGFPAVKGPLATAKDRMHALLQRLCADEALCRALHAARSMPPARFTPQQWEAIGAIVRILPRADAQLQRVFAERGRIDFVGMARAAVQALGSEDEPTDLLLALDVKLRHLLVDEFQDTSHGQWELFRLLTAGWERRDGRSVFLVGDPMQSIYRFREADVGLFLRAWSEGLPQVPLAALRLQTNFRSQAGVVEWVNRHFGDIFPKGGDIGAGAVEYARSSAHHPELPGVAVRWHPFLGTDAALARDDEARRVVEIVREAQAEQAEGSIAVLVRNRSNLDRIVRALGEARIRFRAVDIEPLEGRQVIQDLLAITRALSHPADRIAWLGLLRAPWCALSLADLHALTGGISAREGARATIWELTGDEARLAGVSESGRGRIAHVRRALEPFVEHRLRGSLRERVEAAWMSLGGPACAPGASDLDDAETFFDQLDQLEDAGDLPDAAALQRNLERLYAAPDSGEDVRVQLMTIHKAKGLEFDTVIVPGMDRVPRVSDNPLCRWKVRSDGAMLMAPIRAATMSNEPAYDYLRELDRAASQHELERLLYVAVTRARARLHLMGYARLELKPEGPALRRAPSTTLLGKAWEAALPDFEAAKPRFLERIGQRAPEVSVQTWLRCLDTSRLPAVVAAPSVIAPPRPVEEEREIEFSWVGETARHIGTIAHGWLQRIAEEGLARWDVARVDSLAARVSAELERRGVPPADLAQAAARVLDALRNAITQEQGRWVLATRPDARCEYRIRVPGPEGVRLLVIDRMFSDGGRRWIVDYKTSTHEGTDLEGFLDTEKARYRDRMMRYAVAFGGAAGNMGLYFPLVGGWRDWEA
ncbi:MAG TPA: UvrD-helicase domain-containing protein [Usitatibacter sp.]|nr:UvrD-helicase domain-containing protein [Usitatibacter sp.]